MIIKNVIETIDAIATNQGDHVAYDELGRTHTYADLKAASDRLAAHITNMGLTDKAPIMVYGGQQFEMVASFLGSVKSGHAYVPVDVNSADERLLDILAIGEPALVIAVDDLPIDVTTVPVITRQQLADIMATPVDFTLTQPVTGDDNFYIIFTYGTTGKPKGFRFHTINS